MCTTLAHSLPAASGAAADDAAAAAVGGESALLLLAPSPPPPTKLTASQKDSLARLRAEPKCELEFHNSCSLARSHAHITFAVASRQWWRQLQQQQQRQQQQQHQHLSARLSRVRAERVFSAAAATAVTDRPTQPSRRRRTTVCFNFNLSTGTLAR